MNPSEKTLKNLIINDYSLNKTERKIFFHLLAITEKQCQKGIQLINIKQSTLAKRFSLSVSQISRSLCHLEDNKYIQSRKIKIRKYYLINWKVINEKSEELNNFHATSMQLYFGCKLQEEKAEEKENPTLFNNSNNLIITTDGSRDPYHQPVNEKSVVCLSSELSNSHKDSNLDPIANDDILEDKPIELTKQVPDNIPLSLVNRLINESYPVELIRKAIDYIEFLISGKKEIKNHPGLFVEIVKRGYIGKWDFTPMDNHRKIQEYKQKKTDTIIQQRKNENKERQTMIQTRNKATQIYKSLNNNEMNKLTLEVRGHNSNIDSDILEKFFDTFAISLIESDLKKYEKREKVPFASINTLYKS